MNEGEAIVAMAPFFPLQHLSVFCPMVSSMIGHVRGLHGWPRASHVHAMAGHWLAMASLWLAMACIGGANKLQ